MRRRRALFGALGAGLVGVVLLAVFATRVNHPVASAANVLVGRPAPPITGRDLLSGRAVSLGGEQGRYVLVTFFASWCTPCETEAPQIASFAFAHKKNASVLGVVFNDTAGNAAGFLRRFGATWPAVSDPGTSFAISYGVIDPPESFLVSPRGEVLAWFPGAVTLDALNAELQKAELLGA